MRRIAYVALMLVLAACTKTETTNVTETTSAPATSETTSTAATTTTSSTDTASVAANLAEPLAADIKTTAGDITIRFFPEVAPNHVKNFISLARSGFYNGTKFHRVIPGFMIQGGDPNTKTNDVSTWGVGGSAQTLNAEFSSIHHRRGIVSMARTSDPNSASSQFFIVVADAPTLDNQYSVFGEVTKGMDVVDKIVNAPRGENDRPEKPTAITSVTIRPAKQGETGPAPK